MGSLKRKIEILGDASKFDVCASMASPRTVSGNWRIGNPDRAGICHAFAPDGRCISLFKVLMTNHCIYDCKYCVNNCSNAKTKVMFEPVELARAFMGLYIRNYVEGLFLSSGVWKSATDTSEKIIDALTLIRDTYHFQGYMHIKILPGTDKEYIRQIMEVADRVSLNVELPSPSRLSEVSSVKNYETDILACQKHIHHYIKEGLVPAGQTTQFIVGTTAESDHEIIERLHWEYSKLELKRAYFSGFTPIKGTPLEHRKTSERYIRKRENYLYRIDWLYRRYNYEIDRIFSIMDEKGMVPLGTDPKVSLALKDDTFPLDVNEASYKELLQVPGIGEISSRRIINLRKMNKKISNYRDLQRVGVVVKRAKSFITVNGRRQTRIKEFLN
ncbi:MAG: putative DNA modification/repair radical SAM protein [Candidatus Heimdallarchaeota archaeon]|nr:MAG: putative DNA modification/repair radical SAM protein [Candidatus Heimdallarchaeota archaeon]